MSAFTFRLQRVLDLRREVEQERARVRNEAAAIVEARAAEVRALEQERAAQADAHRAATAAGSTAGALQQRAWLLGRLDTQLTDARDALAEAEAREREAAAALAVASRERRVIDRLRERHLDAWRADEAARERVAMDEVALSRFGRGAAAARSSSHVTPSDSPQATS